MGSARAREGTGGKPGTRVDYPDAETRSAPRSVVDPLNATRETRAGRRADRDRPRRRARRRSRTPHAAATPRATRAGGSHLARATRRGPSPRIVARRLVRTRAPHSCAGFRGILAAWVRARGPEASRRGAVWTRRETSPRTPGRRSSGWSVARARALATPVGAVREPKKHIAGQPVAGFDGVGAGGAPARTPSRRGSRAPRARRPARTRPWPESVRRGAWFPRESECLRDARSGRPAVACGSVSGEIGEDKKGKKIFSG